MKRNILIMDSTKTVHGTQPLDYSLPWSRVTEASHVNQYGGMGNGKELLVLQASFYLPMLYCFNHWNEGVEINEHQIIFLQ